MMTEDEAKTKRCCGPDGCGTLVGNPAAKNDIALPVLIRVCIGSACMAFRTTWESKEQPAGMDAPGPEWVADREWGHGGAVTHRKVWKRRVGWCGLAGRPE